MQWYGPIIEIETKNGDGQLLKRDCPIRRHLKVIMVVDGDEEEKNHTCLPNYMCWTAKWGNFLVALWKVKIGIPWTPDHVDN